MKKSKGTDHEETQTKSKLPCIRCGKVNKSNSICTSCKETICLVHSTLIVPTNDERVCDDCLEIHFESEFPDKESAIDEIRNEMQLVVTQREINTQALCKISANGQHRREINQQKTEDYHNQLELLKEQSKNSKEKLRALEEEVVKKAKDIENIKKGAELARSKLEETSTRLVGLAEECKTHTRERNALLAELNELRDFVKMQIPIRLVKRVVCSACYHKIQPEYYKIFKPETEGTQVRTTSMQVQQKKGACSSCISF